MSKWQRVTAAHQSLSFSRRMMFVGGAQAGFAALLAGRMAWLSIAQNAKYQLMSESNRVQLIPVPPRRGWIIDRNGKPIAINRSSFRVDLIPQQIVDRAGLVAALTRLLRLPPDEVDRINAELDQARGFQPVSVADNIPYEDYAAITVHMPELPGVAASRGFARFYPGGSTVGQLVGYVGAASAKEYERENKNPLLIIPGVKIGKEGLEKSMEMTLRGQPGGQRVEVTARGKLVKELDPKPDRSGGTIQLTIDADLHEFTARRIGEQSCSVVVMDVSNGDILAMPSMPSFNPNNFSDGISRNEWKMLSGDDHLPLVDKALESLYPSGSTIKPSMALALLNAGIDRGQRVNCTGSYPLGNHVFHCDKRHGPVDMDAAVVHSCDIYFYSMCLRVGAEKLAPMIRSMGFGEKFDLPIDGQRYGTVPDPEWINTFGVSAVIFNGARSRVDAAQVPSRVADLRHDQHVDRTGHGADQHDAACGDGQPPGDRPASGPAPAQGPAAGAANAACGRCRPSQLHPQGHGRRRRSRHGSGRKAAARWNPDGREDRDGPDPQSQRQRTRRLHECRVEDARSLAVPRLRAVR